MDEKSYLSKIFFVSAIFLLFNVSFDCKKSDDQAGEYEKTEMVPSETEPFLGIVTASLLRCRFQPELNSKVVAAYRYGSPVLIQNRSFQQVKVGAKTDYWYKVDSKNCWLFGGYLITTQNPPDRVPAKLETEIIICPPTGCLGRTNYYLIGKYYIKLEELPIEGLDLCSGANRFIEMGRQKTEQNRLNFIPLEAGVFSPSGKWSSKFREKLKTQELTRNVEGEAIYFSHSAQKLSRNEAKKQCDEYLSGMRRIPPEQDFISYGGFIQKQTTLARIRSEIESHIHYSSDESIGHQSACEKDPYCSGN